MPNPSPLNYPAPDDNSEFAQRLRKAELAESFLAALIECADDAIVSKTLDGIVTSWNPAAERMFGYSSEDMIGRSITVLIPPEGLDQEEHILSQLRHGERVDHYETQRRRKDGRIIDVSLTVSPIRDKNGEVIGGSKIARDITFRKRLEALEASALQHAFDAQKKAEEANRAKDQFIATVSHELRTPLTAMLGWVGLLMAGQLDAKTQKRGMQVIERNIKSQVQLIEDLLDISRITSGKFRLEVTNFDPAEVVNAAVESLRPAADLKSIQIETVLDSAAGVTSGDSERIQQVVWNLLSNAIKFTPSGGRVQIKMEKLQSTIVFTVADTGIGITEDFLPFVFDRFSQADGSITRSRGGLGMGLAITKSIVELHGGTIGVASQGSDLGTTFTVKLPQKAQPSQLHPRQDSHDQKLDDLATVSGLAGIRVLVVDDESDTREMLRLVFDRCGAVIETASGAVQGLGLIETWKPDILISDIGMPDVDGYEFIRRVRSGGHSDLPAVALTAMTRVSDRVRALSSGYQMHISKPVEPLELVSLVASLAAYRPQYRPPS